MLAQLKATYAAVVKRFYSYLPDAVKDIFIGDATYHQRMSGTDEAWEEWGRRDPYYAVLTQERFRKDRLSSQQLDEFLELGCKDVEVVLQICRSTQIVDFAPRSVLDFGCGVGRMLVPFAQRIERVVGADVAQSMLNLAEARCAAAGIQNVELVRVDDSLASIRGRFDLVHSVMTFQHLDADRGMTVLERLVRFIAPGGVGAIHVTFGKRHLHATRGQPRASETALAAHQRSNGELASNSNTTNWSSIAGDPEMKMTSYNLSEVLFCLTSLQVTRLHVELTDHGGELGAFLFFRVPEAGLSV